MESTFSSTSPSRNGFVAEEETLAKYETAHTLEGGLAYKGWEFMTTHASIADEERIKAIDTLIAATANTQALLKTPEMIFGKCPLNPGADT